MAALIPVRWRVRSAKGAELIEMAIVLPLLLLLVAGIIDFARMFQAYQVVTNAAREAARVRVLPGYGNTDAQNRASAYLAAGGLIAAQATIPVPVAVRIPPTAAQPNGWAVTVQYRYDSLILGRIAALFGSNRLDSFTFGATAAMRSEVTP